MDWNSKDWHRKAVVARGQCDTWHAAVHQQQARVSEPLPRYEPQEFEQVHAFFAARRQQEIDFSFYLVAVERYVRAAELIHEVEGGQKVIRFTMPTLELPELGCPFAPLQALTSCPVVVVKTGRHFPVQTAAPAASGQSRTRQPGLAGSELLADLLGRRLVTGQSCLLCSSDLEPDALLSHAHIVDVVQARALGDRPGFVGLETKLKPKRLGADRNRLSGDARSLGGRSEDIDHVDGLPDVQERGIGLLAQDLSRVGIDRDDPIPTVLKEVGDMS